VDPNPDARPEGLIELSPGAPDPGPASPTAASAVGAKDAVAAAVRPEPLQTATRPGAGPPMAAPPMPTPAAPSAAATSEAASAGDEAPVRLTWAERGAVSLADPVELEAALAEIRLARTGLLDEADRLEATLRAAVDLKAKVRRNPGKAAAVAGGAAFLALGGPRRLLRGARRAVFGAPDPLPASLLPDQVERAVRALGEDGSKVRGALEREFAGYLATTKRRDRRTLGLALLATVGPVVRQAGVEGMKRLFRAEPTQVEELTERLRQARGSKPG
jgi:hypothetical protein